MSGEICVDGICVRRSCVNVECPPGSACANGWCYPEDCLEEDCSDHGEVCVEGECIPADCVGVVCPEGFRCAAGDCYPVDCGGTVCAPDEVCILDECVNWNCVGVVCPPDFACVDGACVEVLCDTPCTLDNQCETIDCEGSTLTCLFDDESGLTGWREVGNSCTDGDPCTTGDSCVAGSCSGTPVVCDSPPANQCDGDTAVTYPAVGICSLGLCDYPETRTDCDPGEQCVSGECLCGGIGADCTSGLTCCGTDCVDLDSDLNHCGGCDNTCSPPNATASCEQGDCTITACTPPWADCNAMLLDGCEASLSHIGDCGKWPTSGGAVRSSVNYRLEIFIAPVSPVGTASSQTHTVKLGPATMRIPRQP
jgi:hypothetical protein